MKSIELTLPEFAFIDGSEHEDNILQGRTVFQHIRSYTIIELFDKEDVHILNSDIVKYEFEHVNVFGAVEQLVLAVHFTLAEMDDMPEILDKACLWYREYCNWEDRNIHKDGF